MTSCLLVSASSTYAAKGEAMKKSNPQGWIKLHRRLRQHWLWEEKRVFSKAEAWIDLLMMANHQDSRFVLGNEIISARPGEVITSELKLMNRWSWSKSKVRAFLKLLENDSMIVKKTDSKKTALIIVNWALYQVEETTNKPEKDHKETAKRPQEDTIKNDKKGKEDNGPLYTPEFESWYSSFPRPDAKADSFKNFEKIRKNKGIDFINQCTRNYINYRNSIPEQERGPAYSSRNFFGQKAYYLDFIEPKTHEKPKTASVVPLGGVYDDGI